MTVETFTPAAAYTVAGIGPYAIGHPYLEGSIRVFTTVGGVEVLLPATDYSLSPLAATVTGNLFLTPAAAAAQAGRQLRIRRVTPQEQGWVGVQGEREKGLERQLDLLTYAVQDGTALQDRTLRARDPIAPFVLQAGRTLLFDGTAIIAGPNATDIANAQDNAAAALASQIAAAGSATAAAGSAGAAAASAATINLPSITGQALNYLRANAGATGQEYRTPAQVRADLGVSAGGPSENLILDGGFDIWQAGGGPFSTSGYGADQWVNDFVGGAVVQSRQAHTVGALFGSVCPQFFLRQAVSGQSAVSHYAKTSARIEGVRSYAGQTITVLFNAARSAGTGNIAVEAYQVFGTGGSPSAPVSTGGQIVAVTGAFGVYAVTIAIPSIAGKILGTNNNDYLEINFWTSAGSNFAARAASLGIQTITVDIWGVHARVGTWPASAALDYRSRDTGTELRLCQRYFQTSGPTGQPVGGNQLMFSGNVTSGQTYYAAKTFAVPMRSAAPLLGYELVAIDNFPASQPTLESSTTFGFIVRCTAVGTGRGAYFYRWVADDRL
jgi:hypothetical protein